MGGESTISEHHFEVTSNSSTFILYADSLKPYLVTEGDWNVLPLYLSGKLDGNVPGYILRSPNVSTRNGKCLILVSFSAFDYESNRNCIIFHPNTRALPITMKSDRLTFNLEALDGSALVGGNILTLALSLIQTSS